MRVSVLLIASSAAILTAQLTGSAQSALRPLLRRAGEYVVRYHDNLTAVVADELYVQTLTKPPGSTSIERTLRSEFAIVRGDREDGWFAIRDVLEVDGRPVKERSHIDTLLRAPRARLRTAAFAIAAEQAKYNLGDVYRTINVPILPLQFLLPDRQTRFRFRASGTVPGSGPAVSVVAYDERERPTIIRTPDGRSVVSRGTFWIDPANGQVWKTELATDEPRGLKAVITVTYAYEKRLGLMVPLMMAESYVTAEEQITGTATYRNFRRFEAAARIVR